MHWSVLRCVASFELNFTRNGFLTHFFQMSFVIGGAGGYLGKGNIDPMMALAAKRRISVATWNIAAINNNVSYPQDFAPTEILILLYTYCAVCLCVAMRTISHLETALLKPTDSPLNTG